MHVTVEDISEIKKRLRVEVPPERVASRIESAYQELTRTAKVKGFRPGKAPRSVLERLYRSQVEGQVAGELIEAAYPEALDEAGLKPIAQPTIEDYDLKPGEGLTFSALIELRPKIEVEGYKGLEIEHSPIKVDDDMIEAQLEMLREQHATMEDTDEPLGEKLWAHADFEAFSEGKPIKALSSMGEMFRLGEGKELSELERAIKGMKNGEVREIPLHLPPNYHLPSLRDKDITFKVTVHQVKRRVLPPMDDELAKEFQLTKAAEVKETVRKELEAKAAATSKRSLRQNLVDKLIGLAEFEVPASMVEREMDQMLASFKQRLQGRQVEAAEVNLEKVRESFRQQAERRARTELILDHIAEQEGVEVTEEEVEKGINELAADLKEEPQRVRQFHEEAGLMDSLRHHLREEKTMDFLLESATLKEKSAPAGAPGE
jgi:trigger factor